MPKISEEAKQRNKEQVLMLVRRHNGLREAEITGALSLSRRTVNNYLNELEYEGKIYKEGLNWRASPGAGSWLRRFELAADEAFTLYLAARQFVKQSDKQNRMALSALSRLAEVLKTDLPVGSQIFQAAQELRRRKREPAYEDIFSTVVKAYLLRHPLQLTYRTAQGYEFNTIFQTYLIEPSAIGYTLYLIGHSSHAADLRSYKIERIVTAVPDRSQTYPIPDDFPGLEILRNSWSIIIGETTQRVELLFSKRVKRRVLETNWHPSQEWEEEADGKLRWWVDVADTTDMKPWIRSWGSDVEVLQPEKLREEIQEQVRQMAVKYNIMVQARDKTSRLLRLWGKTSKQSGLFHPAFYHLLDVGHVAQQLLGSRATPRWRQVLGRALGADPDSLPEWLPFLIALHDTGKLSAPFQALNEAQAERLKDEGFDLGKATRENGRKLHHTITGSILLENFTAQWPDPLQTAFHAMVGGHHGIYRLADQSDKRIFQRIQEPAEWEEWRDHALQLLQSHFVIQWPAPLPEPENVSAAAALLNGFCILCDWLGSDENYFTPKPNTPLPAYIQHSRRQAHLRVKDAGFFQPAVSRAPTRFASLFEFSPRPLQSAIDQIPGEILARPTLTIIEAPTGEGKTEAALALARRIAARRGFDEMYVALPTTATSNAMYGRIQEHLRDRLGLPPHLAQLIHGQSFLAKDDLAITPLQNTSGKKQTAEEWFAPKKKALLAPFGVGTIDQAMLSALNVKHNALRLIGLAGKVIILDEVHAYDTYMTTIIKRMLAWLSALDSSVILLSATLPLKKRQELIGAFAGGTAISLTDQYPSLITVNAAGAVYTPAEPIAVYQPDKTIQLEWLHFTEEQAAGKARWLWQQVQEGGCACWIANTVDRAIEIFKHLQKIVPAEAALTLIHGRFPQEDRQTIEEQIKDKYGKNGRRPAKGIVVGTQVLEQSLDLDFDVMATDLAPIDLLLQRGGRLFRHERDLAERRPHREPRLYVNMETTRADAGIYTEYILNMTAEALHGRAQLRLPAAYRSLIEAVYGQDNPGVSGYRELQKMEGNLEGEAKLRLAEEPDPNEPFFEMADWQGFEEAEDEGSRAWVAALTRWGRESITVIPLQRVGDTAVPILGRNPAPVSLNAKADRKTQLRLLRRSLRLSNRSLITYLKAQKQAESFALFAKSPLLKHVYPLWLEPHSQNARVYVNEESNQPVYLHPDLGLVMGVYEDEK